MKYDTVVWRNTENDAVRSLGVRTVETSPQNVELARLLSVSGAATKSDLTKFLSASQKKSFFATGIVAPLNTVRQSIISVRFIIEECRSVVGVYTDQWSVRYWSVRPSRSGRGR